MYAIIYTDVDYDYVAGVECVKTFQTEEEATKYKEDVKTEEFKKWKDFEDYIEGFIDGLQIPDFPHTQQGVRDWDKYTKEVFISECVSSYIHPGNLKKYLVEYLTKGYKLKLDNYNPPPRINFTNQNLWVVKIHDSST